MHVGQPSGALGLLEHEVLQVQRPVLPGRGVLGRDQEQQVVDQRLHLADVTQQVAVQGRVVQRVGLRHRQLQLDPLGGQGAAQVVGHVGDEPALPLGGPVEPVEHPVHGRGQPADLVVAAGRVDPTTEVGVGDEVDLGADPVEPPQRAPDQQPRGRDEQRPDERYADQQGPPQAGRRLAHRLQAGADVHPDPSLGSRARRGPQPVVLGLGVVRPDDLEQPQAARRRLVRQGSRHRRRWRRRPPPDPGRRRPGPPSRP